MNKDDFVKAAAAKTMPQTLGALIRVNQAQEVFQNKRCTSLQKMQALANFISAFYPEAAEEDVLALTMEETTEVIDALAQSVCQIDIALNEALKKAKQDPKY